MRIANYLRPDCVALRQRADSLTGAVQQMVTLLDGTDNLTDTAVFAADVRAPEYETRLAIIQRKRIFLTSRFPTTWSISSQQS